MTQSPRSFDVVLVGSYPPPHGGQSVHIVNLANYLRARGLTVGVLNTGRNKAIREDCVVNIANSRRLLASLLEQRYRLLHVHVSGIGDAGKLLPARLATLVRKVPWVVTVHSGGSVGFLEKLGTLRRWLSRTMVRSARKIICVNHPMQIELSRLLGPGAAVVIPPYSLEFSDVPLTGELERFFVSHGPILSWIGLFEATYGFDLAVRTLARVRAEYPRAGLVLIGDAKDADHCRKLVQELQLEEHVKICGNLERQPCLSALNRSSVFLRPTLYDGDSISVREALLLGVPVVASRTDYRPEGVSLFEIGDLEGLVAATLEALALPGRDGNRQFDHHMHLEQVRTLYLEMLEGPAAGRPGLR